MYPGLEVEINGEYQAMKPVENAIVVNIGETLEAISNYKIKATKHRVMDIGKERFSSPFFFDPKYSARITNDLLQSNRV
jgi:isopenicillin N synthase-like dioxygenase